jgi:hypothetical protein
VTCSEHLTTVLDLLWFVTVFLTVCVADINKNTNGHDTLWNRVIPDSQSDGTPPWALPSGVHSLVSSPSSELLTSVASRDDEHAGVASSIPQHGRCCDSPMHMFTDLLSALSHSLNEIKDEVVRLEAAFDALSASARTYRCLAAPCHLSAPASGHRCGTT